MIFHVLVPGQLTEDDRAIIESRGCEIARVYGPISVGRDSDVGVPRYAYSVRLEAQDAPEAHDRVAMALSGFDAATLLVSPRDPG